MENKYVIEPDDLKPEQRVTVFDKDGAKIAEKYFYFKSTAIVYIEHLTADLKGHGVRIEFDAKDIHNIDAFGIFGMEWGSD